MDSFLLGVGQTWDEAAEVITAVAEIEYRLLVGALGREQRGEEPPTGRADHGHAVQRSLKTRTLVGPVIELRDQCCQDAELPAFGGGQGRRRHTDTHSFQQWTGSVRGQP